MKGFMTLEAHAITDENIWNHGFDFVCSSTTLASISGRKHKIKHTKIVNIMIVSLLSSFDFLDWSLDCLGWLLENGLISSCKSLLYHKTKHTYGTRASSSGDELSGKYRCTKRLWLDMAAWNQPRRAFFWLICHSSWGLCRKRWTHPIRESRRFQGSLVTRMVLLGCWYLCLKVVNLPTGGKTRPRQRVVGGWCTSFGRAERISCSMLSKCICGGR